MKHKTSNNKYQYSYINKLITKAKTLFIDIFYHPICINACLHYSWGKLVHRNWGDDINVFLIEKYLIYTPLLSLCVGTKSII